MSAKLIYHPAETTSGHVSPFDRAISEMVSGADLLIACPYLGVDYVKRIVARARSWRLLSDVNEWLASHSVESRKAIIAFIENNKAQIRHCPGLHAKVLVSGPKALVGSANFTEKGVTRRVEMCVLFDNEPLVVELRRWFESIWQQTSAVGEADLETTAGAMPPPSSEPARPLPSNFAGVRSKLVPVAQPRDGSVVDGSLRPLPPAVANLLARKSPEIRQLVENLRRYLEDDGAQIKTTNTEGGDIRHYYTDINLSDLRFRKDAVLLKLRVGEGTVNDDDFVWNKGIHDSPDIGTVRLPAGRPIPDKVVSWIAKAKKFTKERWG